MRKIPFLICALFLSLMLAGCAGRQEASEAVTDMEGRTEEVAAVVDRTQMEVGFDKMDYLQLIGDACYYTRYEKIPDSDRKEVQYCRQVGDKEEEILYVYAEEEGQEYYLMCSRTDMSGNWYNLLYETDGQEMGIYLEKRNEKGEELYRIQTEQFADIIWQERVRDGAVGSGGEFYVLTYGGTLLLWDEQGNELRQITAGNSDEENNLWESGLINAGDAGVYLYHSTADSVTFQQVDAGQTSLGREEKVDVSPDSQNGYMGSAETFQNEGIRVYGTCGEYCYLAQEQGLWRYSFSEGWAEHLFDWSDSFVNLGKSQIRQIAEGSSGLILLSYDPVLDLSSRLIIDRKNADELPEKTVITLGCGIIGRYNLEDAVKRYNAQSSQYLVEFREYNDTAEKGQLDEMTAALLKGEGPDLFDFASSFSSSVDYYAAKGILEDLTPYLDESGITLVEPVAEAMKIDGKLYTLGPAFHLRCLVSLKGYSQDGGMSISQCMEMVDKHPDAYFMKNTDHTIMLDILMDANIDSYLDIQGKNCYFDSGEFIGLLDAVKDWKEPPVETIYYTTADELYQQKYLASEENIGSMVEYLILKNAVGDFALIAGYPNTQGEAMYKIGFPSLCGINSASPNKEGAWDFLKYLILEENQNQGYYFPIIEDRFKEALKTGQGEGDSYTSLFSGENETGLFPAPEDEQEIWEMLNHVYFSDNRQSIIEDIISEEAMSVFDGSKTPEQAASVIQNRVSNFLKE